MPKPHLPIIPNQAARVLAARGTLTQREAGIIIGKTAQMWSMYENNRVGIKEEFLLHFEEKAAKMFPKYRGNLRTTRID